jgi:hypothetical protein
MGSSETPMKTGSVGNELQVLNRSPAVPSFLYKQLKLDIMDSAL